MIKRWSYYKFRFARWAFRKFTRLSLHHERETKRNNSIHISLLFQSCSIFNMHYLLWKHIGAVFKITDPYTSRERFHRIMNVNNCLIFRKHWVCWYQFVPFWDFYNSCFHHPFIPFQLFSIFTNTDPFVSFQEFSSSVGCHSSP